MNEATGWRLGPAGALNGRAEDCSRSANGDLQSAPVPHRLCCPGFTELRRDGLAATRHNRLHPEAKTQKTPYITQLLEGRQGPAICAADYVYAYGDQVRAFVPMDYTVLGTDGFGRSDIRANLRRHFEVLLPLPFTGEGWGEGAAEGRITPATSQGSAHATQDPRPSRLTLPR